jgi:hypothetical protein
LDEAVVPVQTPVKIAAGRIVYSARKMKAQPGDGGQDGNGEEDQENGRAARLMTLKITGIPPKSNFGKRSRGRGRLTRPA